MESNSRIASLATRIFIDTALAAHLIGAGAYWWLSPKGFATNHVRFWMNSVLPPLVIVACIALLVVHRRRRDLAALAIMSLSFGWAAAAVTGNLLFPRSLQNVWSVGVAAILVGLFCSALLFRHTSFRASVWFPCLLFAASTGAFAVVAQRPPEATTNPLNERLSTTSSSNDRLIGKEDIDCGPYAAFDPQFRTLEVRHRNMHFFCEPLIDFHRISPDGFWSLRAPAHGSRKDQRFNIPLTAPQSHSVGTGQQTIFYSDGSAVVLPPATSTERHLQLDAYTHIDRDTFSHLNTYCLIYVRGHRSLSLSFSPTGKKQIDVMHFDYPFGRAARFAYLDDQGVFQVVEASSGEKGPFHPLATGKLSRGEPLTITFCDDATPIASLTLDDWSQQLSTQLSPTGGWNVPVNAIEFFLTGDRADSPAQIAISLAATSVGRGWDTVGHREGMYRNRLHVNLLPDANQP